LHSFGPIGFTGVAAGATAGAWVMGTKLVTGAPVFLEHGPLLLLSAVLIQTGIMLIGLGLLAEVVTRVYMDGRHRRIYTVAAVRKPQAWDRPRPVPVPFRPAVRPWPGVELPRRLWWACARRACICAPLREWRPAGGW